MSGEIRLLRLGAWLQLIAVLLGGPFLVKVIHSITPQPMWSDISTFSSHYHVLQSLPYWAGFILITGNVLFVVSAARFPHSRETARYPLALVAVSVYSAIIAFNYTVQVAYIPAAVPTQFIGIELFSMANPHSVAWTLEMFGYGILGAAVWLVAPSFKGSGIRNTIRWLLIADGVTSIMGVGFAAIFIGGMLDEGAIVGYYLWNAMVALIAILVLYEYQKSKNPLKV